MKNVAILALGFIVLVSSCGKSKISPQTPYYNFPEYFGKQVSALNQLNPEIRKIIVTNDESIQIDTVGIDWKKELKIFEIIDLNLANITEKYDEFIDSNGSLAVVRYVVKDTTMELREVNVTRKNGQIQLIEAFAEKHTWVVDRSTRISYLPQKGYGVLVHDNYIWSKPKTTEIFVEIKSEQNILN